MTQWWNHLRAGPAGPALLVCAAVAAIAVRFAPAGETIPARGYSAASAVLPEGPVASVPIGVCEASSAHHLRLSEGVAAHLHRRHDETVVVTAGTGRLVLGADTLDVAPGMVFVIPRGTVHAVAVTEGPIEAISIFAPPFDGTDRVFVAAREP